jgi:hypothetical protein
MKAIPDLPAQVTDILVSRMSGGSRNPLPTAVHKWFKEFLVSNDPSRFLTGIGMCLGLLPRPTNYATILDIVDVTEVIHQIVRGVITYEPSVTIILHELASYVVENSGPASRDSVEFVRTCLEEMGGANRGSTLRGPNAVKFIHLYADRRILQAGHEAALSSIVPHQVLVPLFLKDIQVMTEKIDQIRNRDSMEDLQNAVILLGAALREIAEEWTCCSTVDLTTFHQQWDLYDLVAVSMMFEGHLRRGFDMSNRSLRLLNIGIDRARRDIRADVKIAALYDKLCPYTSHSPNFGFQRLILEEYITDHEC